MQKWEYKIVNGYSNEARLNQLGNEGWELLAVVAGGLEESDSANQHPEMDASRVCLYLKRPK